MDPSIESGWHREELGGFSTRFAEIWRQDRVDGPVFAMRVEPRHLNEAGEMSNGALLAFADHAIGSAGTHVFGESQVTIQLQVSLVSPAEEGDVLIGKGEVAGVTDDVTHLRGTMSVSGKTIAIADGRWKAVRPLA